MYKISITLHLLSFCLLLLTSCQERFDIIIKGGTIIDGNTGGYLSEDIGINGDRITAIGDLSSANAENIINASGLIVCPGFIDSHSHAASGLIHADRSDARGLLTQGLTTIIVNPDGGGPVDLYQQDSLLLANGLAINIIQLVPHGTIREEVMGQEARIATDEELRQMQGLVKREMDKGAWGLSSGPFYSPGSYSDTRELVSLAKVVAPYNGIYTSHIRDESNYSIGLIAAVEEVITVAREANVTGIVTHIKALGPQVWGQSDQVIKMINQARDNGISVFADQYPYQASATGLGAALLPRWAEGGGHSALLQRLGHPDTLKIIREAMAENLERRGGASSIQFRYFDPDTTVQGKTLSAVAQERNLDPISTAIEMIRTGAGIGIVSFNMADQDIANFMQQEWTMTCSDGAYPSWGSGVPHPRSFGSFPRKIRKYVVDDPVMTLPQAIRSMTSLPAEVFGIEDRGSIREGAAADIVVFDLERITDKATFTDPFQYAEGIVHLLVNGVPVIGNEKFLGQKPGMILKREVDPH